MEEVEEEGGIMVAGGEEAMEEVQEAARGTRGAAAAGTARGATDMVGSRRSRACLSHPRGKRS